MMFNTNQIDFMKSVGLNLDFNNLTDDDLVRIEDVIGLELQKHGFDEANNITSNGEICESILDSLV